MLKIVSAPNPVLSQVSKSVPKVNGGVLKLIGEMEKALLSAKDPVGVGLAAPQVGKSLQIFIAKPTPKSKIQVFINPKIITQSFEKAYVKRPKKDTSEKASKKLEGCLSLPNIWGPVLRASSLTMLYLDEQGESHTEQFKDFMATIIQHEMDHLQGVLFPKRALDQKGTLYKSHKNEKGEDEFEEIEL